MLFFDVCVIKTGKCDASKKVNDNIVDRVAMYIGPFTYEGKEFNTIHASGFTGTITPAYYNFETEELLTIKPNGIKQFLKVYDYGRVAEFKLAMEIIAKSPVNLIVTDPDGQTVDVTNTLFTEDGYTREVEGMSYMIRDVDGDGDFEDIVAFPERKIGDYLIQLVPDPDALPTDTYILEVTVNGQTIVLAENVPISDIPRTPYIIRSTETEIIPIIPAFVDFDPNTLNLESEGKYATTYIELPKGYGASDIILESIKLNDQIHPEIKPAKIGDYDDNGISDLMIKFDRSAVQNILPIGKKVRIAIAGKLADDKLFKGIDFIKVISP